MTNPVEKKHFGENGMYHKAGVGAATAGSYYKLVCYTQTTFSSITGPKFTGDALTSIAFPAGTEILGPITGFTIVTAGGVFAYKNEPAL